MVEAASSNLKMLETGYGRRPAVVCGGTLFEKSGIEYIGIDLPGEGLDSDQLSELSKKKLGARFIEGSISSLPLPDDYFDFVLMRSMFGQFRDHFSLRKSSLDLVADKGLNEVHRVLKMDGKIVVVEDNTPWMSDYVKAYLERVGFVIADFAEMDGHFEKLGAESPWINLRSPFYNIPSTSGFDGDFDNPYIMIGRKVA